VISVIECLCGAITLLEAENVLQRFKWSVIGSVTSVIDTYTFSVRSPGLFRVLSLHKERAQDGQARPIGGILRSTIVKLC
jgi:hypothetical protein